MEVSKGHLSYPHQKWAAPVPRFISAPPLTEPYNSSQIHKHTLPLKHEIIYPQASILSSHNELQQSGPVMSGAFKEKLTNWDKTEKEGDA